MAGKSDILNHMLADQVGVFQAAAKLYQVTLLVRRTNTASLRHIGKAYATPKRLDCKAKTADFDVAPKATRLPDEKRGNLAGLVVDPTLVGERAYSDGKFARALQAWRQFTPQLHPDMSTHEKQQRLTYVPGGGLYFVERNPEDPYFGCVKFSSASLISAGKCIHGDFDLYGIVDMQAPGQIVRVREQRLGQTHTRAPNFFDVQTYLNGRFGVAMVLHGSQETYAAGHEDDDLDVFFPDGRIDYAGPSARDIAVFYEREFPGRTLFRKNDPAQQIAGRYMSPQSH